MDVLFMFMGALCLTEGIDLFTRSNFFMFMGSVKEEDYDLKKVFQMEEWIFLMDAACNFRVGFGQFPNRVETILLIVLGATLAAHVYVFKNRKFRKGR